MEARAPSQPRCSFLTYLTGGAGQGNPLLQLLKNLLLQHAEPSSADSASGRNALVPVAVDQVVVDADQGFIMSLSHENMSSNREVTLSALLGPGDHPRVALQR